MGRFGVSDQKDSRKDQRNSSQSGHDVGVLQNNKAGKCFSAAEDGKWFNFIQGTTQSYWNRIYLGLNQSDGIGSILGLNQSVDPWKHVLSVNPSFAIRLPQHAAMGLGPRA